MSHHNRAAGPQPLPAAIVITRTAGDGQVVRVRSCPAELLHQHGLPPGLGIRVQPTDGGTKGTSVTK